MAIQTVWCPVSREQVTRVTNFEGGVGRVICPEYDVEGTLVARRASASDRRRGPPEAPEPGGQQQAGRRECQRPMRPGTQMRTDDQATHDGASIGQARRSDYGVIVTGVRPGANRHRGQNHRNRRSGV